MQREKLRYEFDPHNRLTVKSTAFRGARHVLDGEFKVAGHNTLAYHVKAPVPSGIHAPHQVKLQGSWSLTDEHELRLTLDKWQRQTFGDQVTIAGDILDVRKNALAFAATTRSKDGSQSVYVLELSGSWQADERNRLTFRVNKGRDRFDSLIFDGIWQLDEKYQLIYRYEKRALARKDKTIQTLVFKGYWDIQDKARLSYVLDRDSASGFDFDTSVGIFKDDYIKYELGIGLARKKHPVKRIITLRGGWKIKKDVGLIFEVRQEQRKVQAIVFGAEARLKDKTNVEFSLRNSAHKEIGAELELSRDIFDGDGQAFLRLLASKQEGAIVVGAGWRW